jgi:hypothetical protein
MSAPFAPATTTEPSRYGESLLVAGFWAWLALAPVLVLLIARIATAAYSDPMVGGSRYVGLNPEMQARHDRASYLAGVAKWLQYCSVGYALLGVVLFCRRRPVVFVVAPGVIVLAWLVRVLPSVPPM